MRWLKQLEKKFAWTFLGLLLTAAFGFFGIYAVLLYEKKPQIQYEITSDFNVLEVREDVAELSVLLNGERLDQKKHPLRVLTLRIVNNGAASVLKGHYDTSQPWGFRVQHATVLNVEVLDSNSEYLRFQASPTIQADNSISFDYPIFEPEKYITLKLLLLLDSSTLLRIEPFGKIAGIEKVPILRLHAGSETKGIWQQSFSGNVLVQVCRLLAYPVGVVLIILSIVLPVSTVLSRGQVKRRRKHVEAFRAQLDRDELEGSNVLFDSYERHGLGEIEYLKCLLENPSELRAVLKRSNAVAGDHDSAGFPVARGVYAVPEEYVSAMSLCYSPILPRLLSAGLLERHGSEIKPHSELERILDEFIAFVKPDGGRKKVSKEKLSR